MRLRSVFLPGILLAGGAVSSSFLLAQSPVQSCNASRAPAWCSAVEGDRSQGWLNQHRSEVMARNGMVTTSQPLAAQVGIDILKKGGNAIDAAVATAAALTLMEPMNVGPAGDLFAVIYVAKENKLYALNASGMAPTGQTIARMNAAGYAASDKTRGPGSGMPPGGVLTVTVPGAVWGWDEVLHRFGTMTFKETLQPAIDYAEQGFPVSERIAHDWIIPPGLTATPGDVRGCCTHIDPDAIATWYINGQPPAPGQIFRNPGLAKTYRILQEKGRAGFYTGEVAQAIVAKSKALGGTMTMEDLASYTGEWVTPAATTYHGYDIATLPPPAQTWATEELLNILESLRPVVERRQDARLARPGESEVLAPGRRSQEARVRGSLQVQRRSELHQGPARSAAVEGVREIAVRPRGSEPRHGHADEHRQRPRRHHRALDRGPLGQHGRVGQQSLQQLRLGRRGARLWDHAAQPRRAVHARSVQPQRDRAAQAAVQHAVRRIRDAERPAFADADDGHVDGRRHAGAGHRAGPAERARPRRQRPGRDRHGALSPQPDAERARPGIAALPAGRRTR